MAINLTDVTFDLLVAEQLHDIVPCEAKECERVAHWTVICTTCRHTWLACGPHRAQQDAWALSVGKVQCNPCGKQLPTPLPWVAL